jgi:hypothetical protein
MTDRELIEKAWGYLASYTVGERPNASEVNDFIAVIEDRMNQPEQELMIDCPRCGHCCPQPNQEPDFWDLFDENQRLRAELKFNTTPPQQWVGLTDDEIKEIIGPWGDTPIKGYTRKLFDQIETKLREKNT